MFRQSGFNKKRTLKTCDELGRWGGGEAPPDRRKSEDTEK